MCVEGTRAEPLYCKYVTGTVAGSRRGIPKRRLVLELLLIPELTVTYSYVQLAFHINRNGK